MTMANILDAGQDNRRALDAEIMAKHLMGLLKPKDRAVMTLAYGAGMLMISDRINRLITATNVLPVSVALVGLVALTVWLFQDEVAALG